MAAQEITLPQPKITHTTEGGPLLGVGPLSGTRGPEREKRGDRLPRHYLLPETNVTPAAIDDRKDPLEFDGEKRGEGDERLSAFEGKEKQ